MKNKGGIIIKKLINKINNQINKKEIQENFFEGTRNEIDNISPAYINLQNPKYIEIDNLFYAGLIVTNYYREQTDILLKALIETNINMNISIFYEKQDSYKTIKILN